MKWWSYLLLSFCVVWAAAGGAHAAAAPDTVGDLFRSLPGSEQKKPAPVPRIPLGDPAGFPGTEVTPDQLKVFEKPLRNGAPGLPLDGTAAPAPGVPLPSGPLRQPEALPPPPPAKKTAAPDLPQGPTLEAMAGQMLLVGFIGTELKDNAPILESVRQGLVGGVLLLPRNVVSPSQVRMLTARLQHAAREGGHPPLFIAVEQEGGMAQVLSSQKGFEGGPAAAKLGLGRVEDTQVAARRMGLEMAALGVNLDLAPAGDVNFNPLNKNIGGRFRSFSPSPEQTAAHALAFGQGLDLAGVVPCLTSFPGCGSLMGDAFFGPPDVSGTWRSQELIPYARAVQGQWPGAIMAANVYHRGLDALYPASLSSRMLTDLLRGRLGFKGMVISGDLQTLGVQFPWEEALPAAVRAGADLLFLPQRKEVSPQTVRAAHALLVREAREGRIAPERLRQSWERVMLVKQPLSAALTHPTR